MKTKRLLNLVAIGLLKGKVRNDLASLNVARDKVEKLLNESFFG